MQIYLTGFARSSNFPTANAFDDTFGGGTCGSRDCFDAFVAHLDLDTNTLVYSSYLGGTSDEEGWGIAVDGSGNAYVTGYTMSTDFPVLDAIQETKGADGCSAAPCADAFVTKVDASGSSLVYSTYLGGSQEDFGNAIRADGNGGVFVTGKTLSSDFPTTPGAYDLTLDTAYSDAFVVKIGEAAPPPSSWTTTYTYT
jgi:hypothetical protein